LVLERLHKKGPAFTENSHNLISLFLLFPDLLSDHSLTLLQQAHKGLVLLLQHFDFLE
jgi:hypothetical protein